MSNAATDGDSKTEDKNGHTANDAEFTVAAVTDGVYALLAADFSETAAALEAYEALKEVEDGASVEIEGVLVVKRAESGLLEVQKVTDHSTRQGLGWGALGGVVVGVLFPPSILGTALVGGAGGAAVGALRERHHKKELADELQDAIAPGHSGIVALVSDPGEVKIRKALQKADKIVAKAVDEAVADDLKGAAKATHSDSASSPGAHAVSTGD